MGFLSRAEIDVVVGVEDFPDGDMGDYKIGVRMADTSYEYYIVPQGKTMMLTLLQELQAAFQRCGNHHWATEADVSRLAVSLGIGFFLFSSEIVNGQERCLYRLNLLLWKP
eukprot:8091683-Karenia_brevis.AAC.1